MFGGRWRGWSGERLGLEGSLDDFRHHGAGYDPALDLVGTRLVCLIEGRGLGSDVGRAWTVPPASPSDLASSQRLGTGDRRNPLDQLRSTLGDADSTGASSDDTSTHV